VVSVANPNSLVTITTLNDTLTGADTVGNNQLNITNGNTVTASSPFTGATLRISPGTNGTLALGTNNLGVAALMLDGPNDFSITGTGVIGTNNRYFYVNNPNTTLFMQNPFTSGTTAVVFAGQGTVALTGTVLQNAGSNNNGYRITIADGVLRANNTQFEFTNAATRGVLNLYGGVLEITDGTNGMGAAADFTREIGTTVNSTNRGKVNWGAGTPDRGSGGFSAFGSAASVNIGGSARPTTLQWNSTNFVADGYALKFGSIKSNAVLNFLNPIQLNNGTGYQMREVNVVAGAGGDKTVFQGVISGTSNADFVKTGTGILELTASNTYAGNTFIQAGKLLAGNSTGSATGSGTVIVGNGATLGGTGIINSSSGGVYVQTGGAIHGGAGNATGSTLTIQSSPLTFQNNAKLVAVVGGGTGGAGTATASELTTTGASRIAATDIGRDLTSSTIQIALTNDGSLDLSGNTSYTRRLATYSGNLNNLNAGTYSSTNSEFNVAGTNFNVRGDWLVIVGAENKVIDISFTPVPEPATVLLAGAAALGVGSFLRRKRVPSLPEASGRLSRPESRH